VAKISEHGDWEIRRLTLARFPTRSLLPSQLYLLSRDPISSIAQISADSDYQSGTRKSGMQEAMSQFPLFRMEENLCRSGPRAATDAKQRPGFPSADNNFSASFVFSAVNKPKEFRA
jgi:hypothetical protein